MTLPHRNDKPDMADDTNNIRGKSTKTECATMGGAARYLLSLQNKQCEKGQGDAEQADFPDDTGNEMFNP
jgi:hypothetical protein